MLFKNNKTNEWRRNAVKLKCNASMNFIRRLWRKAFAIYFVSRLIHLSMNLITDFVLLVLLLLLLLRVVCCTATVHNQFHRQFSKCCAFSRKAHLQIDCVRNKNKHETKPNSNNSMSLREQ